MQAGLKLNSALEKAEITGIQHKLEQLNIINVHINFIWEQSILAQKSFFYLHNINSKET